MTTSKANPIAVHEAVDLEIFYRYTMHDSDLQKDVIKIFRSHARKYISDLKYAANTEEWRRAAHTLKGTAKTLGANDLALLSESAEKIDILINNHQHDDLTELRIDLRMVINELEAELKRVVMHFADFRLN